MAKASVSNGALASDLREIGCLALQIVELAKHDDPVDIQVAIQASAEKAGYLADRCLKQMGSTQVQGGFDDWIEKTAAKGDDHDE